MTEMTLDIAPDILGPLEREAEDLDLSVAQYVNALLRERLKVPVQIADLEVFAPVDISRYTWRKAEDETDEEFERAKSAYAKLFGASVRK